MNKFGGNWTENKIEILVEYAKGYLTIMNKYAIKYNWKLMYFDGFAGSGHIKKSGNQNEIIGAAKRILEISEPRSFDMFYFVEKEEEKASELSKKTKEVYKEKDIHIVSEDCNTKLRSMANFLNKKEGKKYKALAYIDPCGMQLEWESLEELKKHSVDVWVLVPTGMGVNRLLKKNGDISEAWLNKLVKFLGMEKEEIISYFYTSKTEMTLFGQETRLNKEEKAIERSGELYASRLNELFEFVSKPYMLRNKTNSIMFHFLMASNNKGAVRIANDIVKKYNNL